MDGKVLSCLVIHSMTNVSVIEAVTCFTAVAYLDMRDG